jgi:hypothetical protein
MTALSRRKTGVTQAWRDRIRVGVLLTRLHDHAEGKIEMTPTQIKAAEILLKKAIPDLKQTDIVGAGPNGELETITRIERVIVRPGDTGGR